jgi:glyoxylase-like metal-dependent hydrolase (beta-lactamase superfamily II)
MTNAYLVDEERLFVVDPGSERNVHLLITYIRYILHRSIRDIDLIVLTHAYPEQRAAAETLRKQCFASIAAFGGGKQVQSERRINIWLHDIEGLPGHPDWRVIASLGHIPESFCLYNPFTRELLCGNTIRTMRGSAVLTRGSRSPAQLEETMHVLRSLPISYLYPGYGRALLSHSPLSRLDVER